MLPSDVKRILALGRKKHARVEPTDAPEPTNEEVFDEIFQKMSINLGLPNDPDELLRRRQIYEDDEEAKRNKRKVGIRLTTLEELDSAVKGFFQNGPEDASMKFSALQKAVLKGETVVDLDSVSQFMKSFIVENVPWNSCKLAATLVLLFASSSEPQAMFEALKFQSGALGGLPKMADILNTSSADLPKRFTQAKKAAIDGKVGKVTVLGVSLVDVEMIERGENQSQDMHYTSFAHSFVLAVGREGFRVYQSWGKHGYRLDQFLKRGGSRLRRWEEAKSFMKRFQKLASSRGEWSETLNSAYNECFEVDINSICGEGKLQNPLVPIYQPWVRMHEIDEVKVEDINKFEWKGVILL